MIPTGYAMFSQSKVVATTLETSTFPLCRLQHKLLYYVAYNNVVVVVVLIVGQSAALKAYIGPRRYRD